MSIQTSLAAAAVVGLAGFAPALAASPAAEVRQGHELADMICTACHQVAANQDIPTILDPPAPSFQAIADRPSTSLASLRRFMAHTKWDEHTLPMKMPDLMLQPEQETALARYILSLRAAPGAKP